MASDPANKKDGKNWSRESADVWQGMTEEERKPWKTKANLKKIKHLETYPNYKFQPKTSVKRRKRSKLTKQQKLKSSRTARKHSLSTSAASDISQPRSLECERIGDTSSSTGSVVYPQVVQDDLEIIRSAFAPASVVETDEDIAILNWLSSPPPLDGVFDPMEMLNVPELLSPSTSSSVDSYESYNNNEYWNRLFQSTEIPHSQYPSLTDDETQDVTKFWDELHDGLARFAEEAQESCVPSFVQQDLLYSSYEPFDFQWGTPAYEPPVGFPLGFDPNLSPLNNFQESSSFPLPWEDNGSGCNWI